MDVSFMLLDLFPLCVYSIRDRPGWTLNVAKTTDTKRLNIFDTKQQNTTILLKLKQDLINYRSIITFKYFDDQYLVRYHRKTKAMILDNKIPQYLSF